MSLTSTRESAKVPLGRSTAAVDLGDKPLRLLVMQPTPFCNIACDYCYLSYRSDSSRMRREIVEAAFRNVSRSGLLGEELGIVWHAGEPLVMSPSFYRESFALAAQILPGSVRITHSIQTNGLLITEQWCDLFRDWRVCVGVSLDGPDFVHDRHRKTRDGRATHARVMRGIDWLKRAGLPFHVIAVVTRDSLEHMDAVIDFFIDSGIAQIGFNIEEAEGANRDSSMRGMEDSYLEFMQRLLDKVRNAPLAIHVRELERARQLIHSDVPSVAMSGTMLPYNPQVFPGAIVSVDHQGRFSTWSPELLDLRHERYGDFSLGNVLTDPIPVALASDKAREIQGEILAGIGECRRSCEFFAYCGGGAPVNKLTENGSFSSADTVYCRCSVQAPLRAALQALEQFLGLPETAPARAHPRPDSAPRDIPFNRGAD